MGPNGLRFDLIYLVGMDYESQINSRFTFVHKSVLVITQGCIRVSEQGLDWANRLISRPYWVN